jgi:hypothetical protein
VEKVIKAAQPERNKKFSRICFFAQLADFTAVGTASGRMFAARGFLQLTACRCDYADK